VEKTAHDMKHNSYHNNNNSRYNNNNINESTITTRRRQAGVQCSTLWHKVAPKNCNKKFKEHKKQKPKQRLFQFFGAKRSAKNSQQEI